MTTGEDRKKNREKGINNAQSFLRGKVRTIKMLLTSVSSFTIVDIDKQLLVHLMIPSSIIFIGFTFLITIH